MLIELRGCQELPRNGCNHQSERLSDLYIDLSSRYHVSQTTPLHRDCQRLPSPLSQFIHYVRIAKPKAVFRLDRHPWIFGLTRTAFLTLSLTVSCSTHRLFIMSMYNVMAYPSSSSLTLPSEALLLAFAAGSLFSSFFTFPSEALLLGFVTRCFLF